MKHLLFVLVLHPFVAHAIERTQLDKMLAAAGAAQSNSYVEARVRITDLGTNALPALAQAGSDQDLGWQQRLVARICYERIVRHGDIHALLAHDWYSYDPYRGILQPGQRYVGMEGAAVEMGPHVVPKCRETGVWYYFIELTWKQTGEVPHLKPRPDLRFNYEWPAWCREALQDESERLYLDLALRDRLGCDPTLSRKENVEIYLKLRKNRDAEAVPILVKLYDAYNRVWVIGLEMYPGENAQIYATQFSSLLSIADSRHAELLGKFISERPALTELLPQLDEVRARPAPAPKPEPPFPPTGQEERYRPQPDWKPEEHAPPPPPVVPAAEPSSPRDIVINTEEL